MLNLLKKKVRLIKSEQAAGEHKKLARLQMLLTIVCQGCEHQEAFRVMTENVNTLGLKFISSCRLLPGEVLQMNILLASYFSNINVKGTVVWCERKLLNGKEFFNGGIEFIGLNELDKAQLERFIGRYEIEKY